VDQGCYIGEKGGKWKMATTDEVMYVGSSEKRWVGRGCSNSPSDVNGKPNPHRMTRNIT
jgi:hypothetical protein